MATRRSPGLAGAGVTALYLLGGIALGLAVALPISAIPTPGNSHVARNTLSGVALLVVVFLASRAWGRAIGRRVGCPDPARMGRVAGFVFAPAMMAAAVVLGLLEPVFVRAGAARGLPIHVVFGILFVAATFLVAGVTAFAVGRVAGTRRAALPHALAVGGAAALAFFGVALGMDAIGWRVGAPDAAQRATMLVVTLLGCLAAALGGGAVLGHGLAPQPLPEGAVATGGDAVTGP